MCDVLVFMSKDGRFVLGLLRCLRLRPFGLRWGRVKDFARVVRLEGGRVGWVRVFRSLGAVGMRVLCGVLRGRGMRVSAVGRVEVLRRYRSCMRCPVSGVAWDGDGKRWVGERQCRQGDLGCGCYLPWLVVEEEGSCWGYRASGGEIGWGESVGGCACGAKKPRSVES